MQLIPRFSGEYMFMRWVLARFQQELPYAGRVDMFALNNQYSEKVCNAWNLGGVHPRVWNVLQKDLIIAHLVGKIKENHNLADLELIYKKEKQERNPHCVKNAL